MNYYPFHIGDYVLGFGTRLAAAGRGNRRREKKFHPARLATEKAVSRTALPCVFRPGIAGMQMRKLTYLEQLQHPNWQRKRLEVMEAAGFSCESCGAQNSMLNVHHKRYVKGRMAWEYEANELQCLCKNCHADVHKHKDFLDNVISQFHPSAIPLLAELLIGFGEESVDPAMWLSIDNQSVARSGAVAWYLGNLSDADMLEVHQFCMSHSPECFIEAIRAFANG